MKTRIFLPYNPDQQFLLPPDMRDWLPEGHLALFLSDMVDAMDLSAIVGVYNANVANGGRPPHHPIMLSKLVIYGYCTGKVSSRKLERATHEEVPYRVLAANNHPDHDTIAHFRKRHLRELAGIFLQVLKMAQALGLVKLGHVALDGTKIKANASKHKAMSYARLVESEARLQGEVDALLKAAETADAEEDAQFGKGKRGDEIPDELKRRDSRLKKIREAKTALEEAAREEATVKAREVQEKLAERAEKEAETGKKTGGRPPEMPDPEKAVPDPKSQRNFTDPESRIMVDGASKGYEQAYNAQAAVDGAHQIIVAADVTQQTNDKRQLVPMMLKVQENVGELPANTSADAGYFSEAAVTDPTLAGTVLHVPPNRQKHGQPLVNPTHPQEGEPPLSTQDRMRQHLATPAGREIYKMRKAIAEPVFGQVKQERGFRGFSFRGLENVQLEWLLVCAAHNLMKIFRSGMRLQLAAA
jgi:transposase